jgi:plastocyanin
MRSRRLFASTFLVIGTLALVSSVACGGGGTKTTATSTRPAAAASPTRPAASPTTAKAASPTMAAMPTAAATAAPTSAPALSPTTAAAGETVEISAVPSLKFDKTTITVKAGSQVTLKFTNNDTGVPHNWAAYTDSSASTPIPGAKTEVCTGTCQQQITFTAPSQPGNYFFRCDVHPAVMKGTLVVQ